MNPRATLASAVLPAGLPLVAAVAVWTGLRWSRPPARRVNPLVTTSVRAPSIAETTMPEVGERHPWRQIGGAVATLLVAVIVGLVPAIATLLGLTVVVPRWQAVRRRRTTARAIAADVPDTIDLLVALIRAGLTPLQAFEMLAERAPPSWRPGCAAVERARQGGLRFVDALDELIEVAGPPARPIIDALSAAERYGHPLGPALERLADEGRGARRRLADAEARRLPVRLSFPLVCCTLPSFVLLTIAPLLAGAFTSLTRSGGRP